MSGGRGLRLSEFCKAIDWPSEAFRSAMKRDELPFFADTAPVRPGAQSSRRLYTGEHALAMAAASLLAETTTATFRSAADTVLTSRGVGAFLAARDRGEDVRDIWIATAYETDPDPLPHITPSPFCGTAADIARALADRTVTAIRAVRIHDAYERARTTAAAAGYRLDGRDLTRMETTES